MCHKRVVVLQKYSLIVVYDRQDQTHGEAGAQRRPQEIETAIETKIL